MSLLEKHQLEYKDLGTNSTDSVDYPDYAKKLAENVLKQQDAVGILVCRSGIGMSIAANRFKGVRAALCRSTKDAYISRLHNNANVLVLGASTCFCKQKRIIKTFLNGKFEGGRHIKRIEKLDKLG